MITIRTRMLTTTAMAAVGATMYLSIEARAADVYRPIPTPVVVPSALPAVDGVNGAFKLFGGGADGQFSQNGGLFGATGIVSVPLGFAFGTQIEGTIISFDGRTFIAGADHLFWRDPAKGLIGLYGGISHYDGLGGTTAWRLGGEAEAYFDRFTIRGVAGIEHGNKGTTDNGVVAQSFDLGSRFFDMVDLVYYPTDNWNMFAGHRFVGGKHALALGTEYLAWSNGATAVGVFAEGRVGEDDYKSIWAGVKIHFGTKDKSLIRRDREDDPTPWEPDGLFGISNSIKQVPSVEPCSGECYTPPT